jgi:multiple sugar transport system substrate-binding protein
MNQIVFLAPDTDAYVASVQRHVGEFTESTGISVDIRLVDSDTYFSNAIHGELEGDGRADVFMSGPVLLWEHVAAGFVEPLDDFVADCSDEWDVHDFVPTLLDANRWTGRFGDALGAGPLLEIPVNCESYNLAYVPEYLDRHSLEAPTTWSAFFDTARELTLRSSGTVRGFGQRGIQVWHTMYTGYATQVWSYGGRDFDHEGKCAISEPPVVAATEAFIEALRAAGPASWADQRWYELALDFTHGKYGLIVDSDHYVAYFEDPQSSEVVGRVRYALPPSGPSGDVRPNLWTWSLVMNSRSKHKQEAWRFIEWASGADFLLRSVFEGNMNPTRRSVWDSALFGEHVAAWGQFASIARDLVENRAKVLVTPSPNYRALADRWVQALRDAYSGSAGVAEALEKAAVDIDSLVASGGNAVLDVS